MKKSINESLRMIDFMVYLWSIQEKPFDRLVYKLGLSVGHGSKGAEAS